MEQIRDMYEKLDEQQRSLCSEEWHNAYYQAHNRKVEEFLKENNITDPYHGPVLSRGILFNCAYRAIGCLTQYWEEPAIAAKEAFDKKVIELAKAA